MAPARTVQTYSLLQSFTCKRIGCLPGLGRLWTRSVLPHRDHSCQFIILDVCRATVFDGKVSVDLIVIVVHNCLL
jgi:hypothetical protein